jgi:hypothetical protein
VYKYLNAWKSGMPVIQGSQVTKILGQMRDQGIIRTEEEYRVALNNLTAMIQGSDPIPMVKFFAAVLNNYADSESFNWMIDRLTDDLTTAFNEADTIESLIGAHQKVYEEFTIAKLKQLIEQIREEIVLHTLLRRGQEGFSNIQFNTFTQNSRSTPPTDTVAGQVYFDYSANEKVSDLAIIDVINESLELEALPGTNPFSGASEVDGETTNTDVVYENTTNLIANIIDGRSNTFFVRSWFILPENKPDAGVQIKIELDCGALRPLNYLEIQPVADYPFQITAIQYRDKQGITNSVELQEAGLLGQDIFRPVRYHFKEIDASKIWITCLQEHHTLMNFHDSSVIEDPEEDFQGTYLQSQMVSDAVGTLVEGNPFLAGLQNLFTPTDTEQLLYQYIIGFDNVMTGKLIYKDIGIFVGERFEVARCRKIGLDTNEVATIEDLDDRRSSFEYWIYKQDYNAAGSPLFATILPILPLNTVRAYERLEFTEGNIGSTRFQAHYGSAVPSGAEEIKVFLNGIELTYGALEDWVLEDEGLLGVVNKTRINVDSALDGEIYTVEYTPAQYFSAAAGEQIFRIGQSNAYYKNANNIINTSGEINSEEVESSDIYLIIIMKNNNNEDKAKSSRLNEYSLLVASQDPSRLYSES